MALSNNPTPNELVKAVKELEQGGGSSTDVQVDSVSQVSGGVANLKTKNGNYNATTNKLVTENDLPVGIQSLTTEYVRISDLESGVYSLDYDGVTKLYYVNTTSTTSVPATSGTTSQPVTNTKGVLLYVSREKTTSNSVETERISWITINGAKTIRLGNTGTDANTFGSYVDIDIGNAAILNTDNTFSGVNNFTGTFKINGGTISYDSSTDTFII